MTPAAILGTVKRPEIRIVLLRLGAFQEEVIEICIDLCIRRRPGHRQGKNRKNQAEWKSEIDTMAAQLVPPQDKELAMSRIIDRREREFKKQPGRKTGLFADSKVVCRWLGQQRMKLRGGLGQSPFQCRKGGEES